MHCTFPLLRSACSLRAVRGIDSFWGRACQFQYAAPFRGGQTHIPLQRIPYLAYFSILSTTISCHLTFSRQRLMPFVEERDINNDVISVLEDSFVVTSVNVCMQLLRTCYWASRRTCSMPIFDKEEEILGDWLSDPTPDPTDMDSVRFRRLMTFM